MMREFIRALKKSTSLYDFQILIAEKVSNHFSSPRVVLQFVDTSLHVIAPPFEWVPDNGTAPSERNPKDILLALRKDALSGQRKRELSGDSSIRFFHLGSVDRIEISIALELPLGESHAVPDEFYDHEVEILSVLYRLKRSMVQDYKLYASKGIDIPNTISNGLLPESVELVLSQNNIIHCVLNSRLKIISSNDVARKFIENTFSQAAFADLLSRVDEQKLEDLTASLTKQSPTGNIEVLLSPLGIQQPRSYRIFISLIDHDSETDFEHKYRLFGFDQTSSQEVSRNLLQYRRGIETLFAASSAICESRDMGASIASVLQILCEATGSSSSLCYLAGKDGEGARVVGQVGYSESEIDRLEDQVPEVFSIVFRTQQVLVSSPMFEGERQSWYPESTPDSILSLIVPLAIHRESYGVLILSRDKHQPYESHEIDLVSTLSSQLALAVSQERLLHETQKLAAEARKEAVNFQTLYRLSHELSTSGSVYDVFHSACKIMSDELGVNHFWMGLLNDEGTHVVGQGAYGIGLRKKAVEVNIELDHPDNPIGKVVRSRQAFVVKDISEIFDGLGLRRFLHERKIDTIGLVPMTSSGQLVGVLAFSIEDGKVEQDLLFLVQSLCSEVAQGIIASRMQEQIAATETMRAAGLLAAGIAHNFNNLLQGILGQASLLELYSENGEQVKKSSEVIVDAATRGAELVKQLINVAYLEEPSPSRSRVKDTLLSYKIPFQKLLKGKQYIRYNLPDDNVWVSVDLKHFKKILEILCENASDAMDDNGLVSIYADTIIVDQNSTQYEVPDGSYVRIVVRDNGVGMSPEVLRRCFEPFFTTKDVDPGTGLGLRGSGMGLSVAFALARKNAGRLIASSRKGEGSQFTLFLPKADEVPLSTHLPLPDIKSPVKKPLGSSITREALASNEKLENNHTQKLSARPASRSGESERKD